MNRYCRFELRRSLSNDCCVYLQLELSFSMRLAMMKGIADGMKYLHSRVPAIIHRDLKRCLIHYLDYLLAVISFVFAFCYVYSLNILVSTDWEAKVNIYHQVKISF